MTITTYSHTCCTLGEGALWHPRRGQLFWFDILSKRLLTRDSEGERYWDFDTFISAAGWIDGDTLLIAGARGLMRFNIATGAAETLADLEADNPLTRSNDGRTDPWGGFWVGTMGIEAEAGAGAIYRYYRGEIRCLVPQVTISNAICFSPDGLYAFYTDTPTGRIMRQPLAEADGWPVGDAEVWLDLSGEAFSPDGAVIDADGYFCNAQWGAGRVARYGADGVLDTVWKIPALQASCPAFGGDDFKTLFVTSAVSHRPDDPEGGKTFAMRVASPGQAEHRVIL